MLLRGSAYGAKCEECPFATNGQASRPVTSEYPEDPLWILVGDGPGRTEVQLNRPFQGSQQLIEKMLSKIGRRRDELVLTTAILCGSPVNATEHDRERAAKACKPRLDQELAQWPGMPVLTLGSIAARTLIPKATLDAIDPPNVPKSKKKSQKERQKAEAKALVRAMKADARAQKLTAKLAEKRQKAIDKIAKERLKGLVDHQRKWLIDDAMRPVPGAPYKSRKKPSRSWVDHEMERYLPKLKERADADAIIEHDLAIDVAALQIDHGEANPKPVKPAKHKPAKITDLMSTCFDVDVDGTGVTRPLIPTIHPASLLRGGGATIGGTHTPDLAFINLYYDASKIDALAQGKDIRLKVNVETEIADPERCGQLMRDALDRAMVEGELSIDLETYVDDIDRHHALMAYMARIRTIGLATNDKSISVMWDQIPAWALSYLQLVLARPNVTKTFHNGIYDRTVLTTNGYTVEGPWEDCYVDSETEFLTAEGWKKYDEIGPDALLGTVAQNGQLEWQPFYHRTDREYAGRALVFETLHTRAVVTPNHRMWVRPLRRTAKTWGGAPMGPWGFVRAEDLLGAATDTFEIQQACTPPEAARPQHDAAVIELLGIWLADGSLNYHRDEPATIIISQEKNGRASSALRRLAKTLPLTVHERLRDDAWRTHSMIEETWRLGDRTLAARFAALGRHSRERRLPPGVFAWSYGERVLLLEALFLGDGSPQVGRNSRFIYRSGSPQLADDVQALALSLGWTATNPPSYRPDGIAHVFVNRAASTTIARMRTSGTNARVTETIVDDRIVCFSVPNETLITRSHGKPAFYGNTLLGHHAAFPGCAHRLQSVTSQFFAVSPWKSEFRNAEETPEGLTKYNALDTGATHALRPAMTLWIKRTKTEKIYALDKKMAEIASKMHLAGMPVSREVNSELLDTFTHNVVESRRAVEAVAEDPALRDQIYHYLALQQAQKARLKDPTEWKKDDGSTVTDIEARYEHRLATLRNEPWKWRIGAGKHIAALLQALGVSLIQRTESGQISTKKDILEGLVDVPIVRDILTFRENDKLLSTFIWQIFDRFDSAGNQIQYGYADGNDRIHPIWTVHKITGRWASSEPVVSNVPKDKFKRLADGTIKILRPNLRKQIVAPPGRIFVGFDFAQLEARIIALISGDPFLCQVFADGKDIHRECARVIFAGFDQMPEKDQKKARDETKPLEYGAFYGGAPETLWKQMLKEGRNVKLADIAKAIATLMNKMAGVVAWQRSTVALASQPPYEIREFLYGRRRTFPLGQVEATEAMNFGVQAAGASIMNTGMARMDDALGAFKEAVAIAQIHDAAVFECWADDAPKLAEEVNRCFYQEYERDGRMVPFPVDVKINQSWAGV